jgi:lipocalin-like protein
MGQSLRDQLLGTWRLESFHLQQEAGEAFYWWGHDVVGRVTFDEEGRFTAQVGRRDRQPLKSEQLIDVTPDEAREAFLGYLAYFGTYVVDEIEGAFTTRVEGSLVPNWIGTEQKRWASVDGDRAVFTARAVPSPMGALTPTLAWRRLS